MFASEQSKSITPFLLPAFILSVLMITVSCGGHSSSNSATIPLWEMTVGSPVNDTVRFGGFNAYAATVTQGALYKISITGVSDDVDLNVYGTDGTFRNPMTCAVNNASLIGIFPEDCITAATGGTLYFGVDASYIAASAAGYTIDIELVPMTNGTAQVPLADSTTQKTARAYAVTVTPGVNYTISITGLNDDADLFVFGNDGTFSAQSACLPNFNNTRTGGASPEDCTLTSSGTRSYFIVDGIFSSTALVSYTALAAPTPVISVPAAEGSIANPLLHSPAAPWNGQVGFAGTSYYVVNALSAGARYTISITGLSADADLSVWNDSAFTVPANCLINNAKVVGSAPEACTVQSTGTSIYFSVTSFTTSGGVAFIGLVEPGP